MTVTIETLNWSKGRESVSVECSFKKGKGRALILYSPQRFRGHKEGLYEPECRVDQSKTVTSGHNKTTHS